MSSRRDRSIAKRILDNDLVQYPSEEGGHERVARVVLPLLAVVTAVALGVYLLVRIGRPASALSKGARDVHFAAVAPPPLQFSDPQATAFFAAPTPIAVEQQRDQLVRTKASKRSAQGPEESAWMYGGYGCTLSPRETEGLVKKVKADGLRGCLTRASHPQVFAAVVEACATIWYGPKEPDATCAIMRQANHSPLPWLIVDGGPR